MSESRSESGPNPRTLRSVAFAALVLVAVLIITTVVVLRSPDFPLLTHSDSGQWITSRIQVGTNAIPIHPDALPLARLAKPFSLPQGGPLVVQITALRGYELSLNGSLVASRDPSEGNWKEEERIELADAVGGQNELRVVVRNTTGPAAVRMKLSAPGFELSTDTSWLAIDSRGAIQTAVLADDRNSGAVGLGAPTTWQLIASSRDTLIFIGTAFGLLSLWLTSRQQLPAKWWTRAAWAIATLLWAAIFLRKGGLLPAFVGYDGPAHIEYVRFLLDKGTLPFPEDGFSMYHPPLFYTIAAVISWIFGGGAGATANARESAEVMIRVVPALAGFLQIAVAYALSRRLFPGDTAIASLTVVICALLPMNVYMAMYVSNEPLNALLAGVVLLQTTDLLLRNDLPMGRVVALAAVLGLALLTKATSLMLLPLVGVALAAKHLQLDRAGAASLGVRVGVGSGVLAAVSGWYFLRNWLTLGSPSVGNWNVTYNDVGWFQQPGYHTPSYYLRFGESLTHPFYAGFHSFWDGMYSTFWGDGLVAGVISLADRHPFWNYDYMSIAYVLALPASAILLAGIGSFCIARGPDARGRLARGFLGATIFVYGFAVLVMTMRLPFYAQAKSSYALSVVAPVAVAGAYAFVAVDRALATPGRKWLRIAFHAWGGALAVVLGVAFGG